MAINANNRSRLSVAGACEEIVTILKSELATTHVNVAEKVV